MTLRRPPPNLGVHSPRCSLPLFRHAAHDLVRSTHAVLDARLLRVAALTRCGYLHEASGALAWLLASRDGYCGETRGEGDCAAGGSGSFRLGVRESASWAAAATACVGRARRRTTAGWTPSWPSWRRAATVGRTSGRAAAASTATVGRAA